MLARLESRDCDVLVEMRGSGNEDRFNFLVVQDLPIVTDGCSLGQVRAHSLGQVLARTTNSGSISITESHHLCFGQ